MQLLHAAGGGEPLLSRPPRRNRRTWQRTPQGKADAKKAKVYGKIGKKIIQM
jgi:hypothetical protein